MLVVYPTFSLLLGLAYALGDPARTATPSFDAIRGVAPLQVWGCFFILLGSMETAAWLTHRRKYMILALCVGFAAFTAWAVGFLIALLTVPNAALTGPVVWGFVAIAHVASLQSITKDSPR